VAGDEIGLERVLQVYREESRRKALTTLEPDFWERVQVYVGELEGDLTQETTRDPNSAKAALLRDELKKVLKRREQIWQYRGRKMALMAWSAAAGATTDIAILTPLETKSFDDLMAVLDASRRRAFGEGESVAEKAPPKPAKAKADNPKPKKPPARPARQQVLLRVLEDVPPFAGLDVTYHLRKQDVVSLPPKLAKVLTKKGTAEEIHPRI
jgi:DNA replication factor GINS